MKKFINMTALSFLFILAACSTHEPYHKTAMPDPTSFNAHFGDMDQSGDDLVDWDEFKAHFSHAKPDVYRAIDLNGDDRLDHDEWHAFKDAHGMREHD